MGMLPRRDFSTLLGLTLGVVWATGCDTGSPSVPAPAEGGSVAQPGFQYSIGTQKLAFTPGGTFRLDPSGHQIVKLHDDGTDGLVIGGFGADGPAVNFPVAVVTTKSGAILVLERGASRVTLFDGNGKALSQIGKAGAGPSDLHHPAAMLLDDKEQLWVVDTGNHRVQVYALDGSLIRTVGAYGATAPGELHMPRAIARDSAGNVHVLDSGNGRLHVFDPSGQVKSVYGKSASAAEVGAFVSAREIELGPNDDIFVVDSVGLGISVFDKNGVGTQHLAIKTTDGKRMHPLDIVFPPNAPAYIWAIAAEGTS